MTHFDELTAAADALSARADAAQHDLEHESYWQSYPAQSAWADGFTNGMGGPGSDLVALLPPSVVLELAHWLRAEARNTQSLHWPTPSPHALATARAINQAREATCA
ncbi:hypothetical protein [Streptomyces sp. C10-9-1]|uniref:hypothetical protein n=1 Tax=Streptomyces sp. C10-9-1 TaxID=1859285 RepID=UPI003F49CF83